MFKAFGGTGDEGSSGANKASSGESFSGSIDPTGLERAAKAARQIDASPNARAALDLTREQEITKQKEFESRTSEYRAAEAHQRAKNIELQGEQQRATLGKQAEYTKGQEQYRDKLERDRQKDVLGMQIQAQRSLKEEERNKDEESVARQEAMRRKTLEYETALRQQADAAKAKAEAQGRIQQQRQNHDLAMQTRRLELRESRKTTLESIKVATSSVGAGLSTFVSDKTKVATTAAGLSAAALGIYSARSFATVVGGYIAARLGKPSLVRETSRITLASLVREPAVSIRRIVSRLSAPKSDTHALNDVVLAPGTHSRLERIARATKNARRHHAPFRNVLLTGPPGTGKTLFAKGLARSSGLEYAIFTGGDLAPLGSAAVTELHKLFDWAATSRRGLLLFIDEADAFLRTRGSAAGASEDMRNALNAFLYRTGEPSSRFMMMMATNRPHEFDEAAADRVDDVIPFDLPSKKERTDMLKLYVEKFLKKAQVQVKLAGDGDWKSFWKKAVDESEGFSGREMAKLVVGWQAAGYSNPTASLTMSEAQAVLAEHIQQKELKDSWAEAQKVLPSNAAQYRGQKSATSSTYFTAADPSLASGTPTNFAGQHLQ